MHKLPLLQKFSTFILNFQMNYISNFDVRKKEINRNYSNSSNNPITKGQFVEWLSGFIDSEGNFDIGVDSRNKFTRFNFSFRIGLHYDDLPLLNFIKGQLNCGRIIINKDNTSATFVISDTKQLISILFPILEIFPLNTTKHLDFISF
jgi:hypothetical protein